MAEPLFLWQRIVSLYIADDDSEGHNSSYDDDGGGGGGNSGKKLYSLPTAVIPSCSVQ